MVDETKRWIENAEKGIQLRKPGYILHSSKNLKRLHHPDIAQDILRRAYEHFPDNLFIFRELCTLIVERDPSEGFEFIKREGGKFGNDLALQKAIALDKLERRMDAITELENAINTDNKLTQDRFVVSKLATLYLEEGLFDKSVRFLEPLIIDKTIYKDVRMKHILADTYIKTREPSKVLELLKKSNDPRSKELKRKAKEIIGEKHILEQDKNQIQRKNERPIAFICHASEDKDSFVRPLAQELDHRGLSIWYDEFSLTVGDSLRRSIDRGLAQSRFGIVVLSPNFFKKEWPQKELDGLATRETNGVKVILPVWHNVSRKDVARYSPTLADRVAVSTSKGLEYVVTELLRAIQQGQLKESSISEVTKISAGVAETEYGEDLQKHSLDNTIAFVNYVVFLGDVKELEEIRPAYEQGLSHFSLINEKGTIKYVWSAILRKFARRRKDQLLLEEAKSTALDATRLAPDNPDAWLECGQVFRDLGNIPKASEHYEKCLRIDPNKAECLASYAMMLQEHCTSTDIPCQNKIIDLLKKLLVLRPDDIISHDVLGNKYLLIKKDIPKAELHLNAVRSKIQTSTLNRKQKAVMLFHQGQFYEEKGNLTKALEFYKKSVSYDRHPNCVRRIAAIERRLSSGE